MAALCWVVWRCVGLALTVIGLLGVAVCGDAQYVSLTGQVQGSNGVAAANYTMSFTPSQVFFVAGTGVVVNSGNACYTSADGSVVGIGNPLSATLVTPQFSGTLGPGNYFVEYTFYTSTAETLASPESSQQLTGAGALVVAAPTGGVPSGVTGMRVYIGTSPGAETLQGQTTGTASFTQGVPLAAGAGLPATNSSVCKQVANDAGWPTGTGYTVSLTDTAGNTLPGYPMMWQLMGAGTTIDLSSGLPYYHGVVYFPSPLLASPINHATQSVSGPLTLGTYNFQAGSVNALYGYKLNGSGGTAGQCLLSDGTALDTFATCVTTATVTYQAVQGAGSSFPAEGALNFLSPLTVADDPANHRTNVGLGTAGTAGTYAAPTSVTTDVYGRVTAITSGGGTTPVARTCTGTATNFSCYKIDADGTITEWGQMPGATSGGTESATNQIAYPYPFTTELSLTLTAGNGPDGTNNDAMTIYATPTGTPLTTANVVLRCASNIGGSGCPSISNAVPIFWQAKGY